jgi:hypothetical protein
VGAWLRERDSGDVTASPREYAEKMRTEAVGVCAHARWTECARMLDRAREADPDGDATDQVCAMRLAISRAMPDAGSSLCSPR